ncbi:MAG: protein kinase domain-containing protein [Myxococcota bacterium]
MAGPWRPEPGTTLDGRVAIEREIGAGPTGVVYAGRDLRVDVPVAVKVFHPALFQGSVHGPNLLRLQRARAYVHEDVVRLHDVVVGDRVYAITDLVEAPSLERLVAERGAVAPDDIPGLLGGVVDALGWIHQIAVHGNLKPSNVFVPERGGVLVGDPWCLEGTVAIPQGDLPERPRAWMAPEQIAGAWKERPETDVLAVARLVAWLLAGRVPAEGRTLVEQGVPVPEPVEAVLLGAMAPHPDDRPSAVGEFWGGLLGAWRAADWEAAESRATAAESPGGTLEDEEEPPIGSQTEAIPLDELRAMGLDPGVDDAEEVEAVVVDEAAGAEAADTTVDEVLEVDADDVVAVADADAEPGDAEPAEVEADAVVAILEEEEAEEPPPHAEVTAAPGLHRSEPEVRPGPKVPPERDRAATGRGTAFPTSSMPAARTAARPRKARTRRSPMIFIAPLLFALAGVVVFYALDTLRERQQVPVPGAGSTRAQAAAGAGAGEEAGRTPTAADEADAGNPGGGAADAVGGEEAVTTGRGAGAALAVAAKSGPPEAAAQAGEAQDPRADEPAEEEPEDEAPAAEPAAEEPEEPAAEEPEEPTEPVVVGPTPAQLECPGGMAEIRRKRDVELDDGTPAERWDVWCVDRYEFPGRGSKPRVDVSRAQAASLCRAEGKRLCTRAEWRQACGWNYPYKGDYDPDACNTIGSDFMPRPLVPSGSKRSCRNGWGLYDMVGNAAEWTSDGRVNGGSAKKDGASAKCQRSARRKGGSPYVGFRCCADPTRR